jgi:hypothetical protein
MDTFLSLSSTFHSFPRLPWASGFATRIDPRLCPYLYTFPTPMHLQAPVYTSIQAMVEVHVRAAGCINCATQPPALRH